MLMFDKRSTSHKVRVSQLHHRWLFITILYGYLTTHVQCSEMLECPPNDHRCEQDRFGFEALSQLHKLIDDDHDGSLDRSESDEFIRDEMKYEDGFDRHTAFHGSDDLISVQDMWIMWTMSGVYNWTVDDVLDWLIEDVELPQYSEFFRINAVDGHMLPRLATNGQYMTSILGIKNGVHKQKLNVKATDIVLFGPPKRHNYVKDLALLLSTVIAIGGFWLAYVQHRYSQTHMRKVMVELETLQSAEDALKQIQAKLDRAERGHRDVAEEKQNLERKLQGEIRTAKDEAERLREERESTEGEKQRHRLAEQELVQVRMALSDAEQQLEARSLAPLAELQQWLQLTYEIENNYFEEKKEKAEKQMLYAKEMCEKIRKKRGAFLGSLRIAHTTSIDDTDHSIVEARAALEDMKMWLQERSQRWRQVENICGFNITINPGLQYLESMLRGTGYTPAGSGTMSHSISTAAFAEEFEDDSAAFGLLAQNHICKPLPRPPSSNKISQLQSISGVARGVGGGRQDFRPWPGLMRAGMQLTMLGIGLTNPNMAGALPGGNELRERRVASIRSAFGGSSSSLHSRSGAKAVTPTCTSQDIASDVPNDNTNQSANGDVKFDLEDTSQETNEPVTSNRSVSLDNGKPVVRPKTFNTSFSESALSVGTRTSAPANLPRPNSLGRSRDLIEEDSSPESTDSTNVLDPETKEKKKKSKLLSKLMRGSKSSKHK